MKYAYKANGANLGGNIFISNSNREFEKKTENVFKMKMMTIFLMKSRIFCKSDPSVSKIGNKCVKQT